MGVLCHENVFFMCFFILCAQTSVYVIRIFGDTHQHKLLHDNEMEGK